MNRKTIFDAIRSAMPRPIDQTDVRDIDALLDGLGVPREGAAGGRTVSPKGIALMHEYEGLRLTAYPDPGSRDGTPWTIGRGSTGPGIHKGVVWTEAQADARFADDLAKFAAGVDKLIGAAPTTQGQFDAIVSFSYNVGLGAFKDSTLRRLHLEGDYGGAAQQFLRWDKNDSKVMPGLTRRRRAERALYLSAP